MSEVNLAPVTLPRRLPPGHLTCTGNRASTGHGIGEIVAAAGLLALIFQLARTGAQILGAAIGLGLVIALFPRHTTIPEPKAAAKQTVTSTVPAIQES